MTTISDQTEVERPTSQRRSQNGTFYLMKEKVSPLVWWMRGLAAVVIVLVVSLLIWGPRMEYPTTVSSSEIVTSGGNTVTLTVSVRELTGSYIDNVVEWMTDKGSWLFDGVSTVVTYSLVYIENTLMWVPWPALIAVLALISYAAGKWQLLLFTTFALLFIGFMGLWENMVDTIALMVVAVVISIAIGLPIGVMSGRNHFLDEFLRPVLDAMQTMPSFVYLLPGILFFGLGKPAGIFATIIYAVPPVIRLTSLGIQEVSFDTIEAAQSFGSSPMQILTKVQIPMALPTIMAGINQTTMMALSMVTIASMVAAGGLGDTVLRALQKNEPGNGAIAGLSVVFMAIVIDRLTQSVVHSRSTATKEVT